MLFTFHRGGERKVNPRIPRFLFTERKRPGGSFPVRGGEGKKTRILPVRLLLPDIHSVEEKDYRMVETGGGEEEGICRANNPLNSFTTEKRGNKPSIIDVRKKKKGGKTLCAEKPEEEKEGE